MNVRIVWRHLPQRTDLYGGIEKITADGRTLTLLSKQTSRDAVSLNQAAVAEILLDDEPGDWW